MTVHLVYILWFRVGLRMGGGGNCDCAFSL